MAKDTPRTLPVINFDDIVAALKRHGYESRVIAAGQDGQRRFAVHKPDPVTAKYYNPRSYFSAEQFYSLVTLTTRSQLIAAIQAAQHNNKYLLLREDESDMSKSKTNAAAEKAAREARAAKKSSAKVETKKAVAAKAAPKAKAVKAAKLAKNGNGAEKTPSGASVKGATPEILAHLASFQDQTIERMNGARVVETYLQINAATAEKPVMRADLSVYPKRIAGELQRMGLVAQDRFGRGVGYFAKQ